MVFFTFLLMDSAVSAVLRKELGVRGAARKFSMNRHSLPTRLLLIERSEGDDLDSGRNYRLPALFGDKNFVSSSFLLSMTLFG